MTRDDDYLLNGAAGSAITVILAHGAGAPMDSPFMTTIADLLAARGMAVVRFEFPYMAGRRSDDKKRPPDRAPVLLDAWRHHIQHWRDRSPSTRLMIGGKSMGGRIASMVADEMSVDGLVCLGYPFHPPGKPDKLRTDHLQNLKTPTLIVQGDRDPFGTRAEVLQYDLSSAITVQWIDDGDHDLSPRKMIDRKITGRTKQDAWQTAADAVAAFAKRL